MPRMEQLVTSVRVVCRSRPSVAAVPDVCEQLASFLAPPDSWTIERAIRSGHRRLALHLIDVLLADPNRHYLHKRAYVRVNVMPEAAAVGDVALLGLLVARFGCCVDSHAVEMAVGGGHLEALEWLVDQAVAGLPAEEDVQVFTARVLPNRLAFISATLGYLEMLQWICERVGGFDADTATRVLSDAAQSGHLDVVEWVLPLVTISVPSYAVAFIASRDYTDVIRFLYAMYLLPLTSDVMDAVAGCGSLQLLQWMYDNDGDGCTSRGMEEAASSGLLDSVRWLHSRGVGCTELATAAAARNGHLEVLQFLLETFPDQVTWHTFNSAVRSSRLAVVQYLFDHRHDSCLNASLDDAVANGDLDMIKWLQTNCPGVHYTTDVMNTAAANGHLEIVQFLHESRVEGCSTRAMDCAAKNGFLEVVEWLHFHRTEGCTTDAMYYAARYGRLDIVEFLQANRTEGCTTEAMDMAACRGHLEVVKFLHFHRTEGCTTWAMDFAAENGHLDIVEFLHFHRSEGCTTRAMNKAAANGHLEIVKFLHWHRTEGCTTRAMDYAGNVEVAQYLSENRSEGFTGEALIVATGKGDVRMREWLRMRAPLDIRLDAVSSATEKEFNVGRIDHIEVLEWLTANDPALIDVEAILEAGIRDSSRPWWVYSWLRRRVGTQR